jgi:positive regulator of sigma E activity
MKETGIVTFKDDKTLTVKVKRRAECSKCGLCGMKENATDIDFLATYGSFSKDSISEGDVATVESNKDIRLVSYLLLFIVPIILIGASIAIGYLFLSELWSVGLALISVACWYFLVWAIDKKFNFAKKAGYVVTSVIKHNEEVVE